MTSARRLGMLSSSGVRPRTRRRRVFGISVVLVVVALIGAIAWPFTRSAGHVDAVVMLAGADDGRHAHSLELIEQGTADVLLVSNSGGRHEPLGLRTCRGGGSSRDATAECFRSDPVTTAGEASAVESIARDRGWESVAVVTNRPHTPRAWWTFTLCTDLDVAMAPIDDVNWRWFPYHVTREVGGTVRNVIRGCPHVPSDPAQGLIR